MATGFNAESSITIAAPIEKVWEALTTPEIIKQWFFGVDTATDWKVGSPLVHTGEYQGEPYVDKGVIERFNPPRLLAHSHWSSGSGLPDAPEHYQHVTYTLSERGGGTELTMNEVNIPSKEMQTISEQSWAMALKSLKELLEK